MLQVAIFIYHSRHHRRINSNYRSKLDTRVPFIRFEMSGERKAKLARKTKRGRKDAETTIVLGNEA